MNTQTSDRPGVRPLDLWPVASLTGTHLPVVVAERNHVTARAELTADDEMARFAWDFCTFVARLTAELESLREGLAQARTDIDVAQRAPAFRYRARQARIDELTEQLQELRGDVSRVLTGPAEVPGKGRFASVAVVVGTGLALAAFSD